MPEATGTTATLSRSADAAGLIRPDGAIALVTGGGRGIGAAVAQALAADGWAVALTYRASSTEPRRPSTRSKRPVVARSRSRQTSPTPRSPTRRSPKPRRSSTARFSALVNNAGIRDDDLVVSLDDERWQTVIDTNLTAAFRLTRAALRPMIRARYGRVVNVASIVGPRANAGQSSYAAAKAGLIGFTKTAAHEVARRGVTVNAVAPGFVATDMTADLPASVLDGVPARRAGTPDEVAACVRFLASEAASYVTATTLYVDGGLAA